MTCRAAISAALVLLAGSVSGQTAPCLPRDALVETLTAKYGEHLVGGGMRSAQQVIEVWSSPDGSFTIFTTRSDGVSCIIATGQGWHTMPSPLPGVPG